MSTDCCVCGIPPLIRQLLLGLGIIVGSPTSSVGHHLWLRGREAWGFGWSRLGEVRTMLGAGWTLPVRRIAQWLLRGTGVHPSHVFWFPPVPLSVRVVILGSGGTVGVSMVDLGGCKLACARGRAVPLGGWMAEAAVTRAAMGTTWKTGSCSLLGGLLQQVCSKSATPAIHQP